MSNSFTIILTIIYFVAILLVGYVAGKKTRSMSEFMIGGQSLGVWVTSLGIMAAVMSGWTWLGNPGYTYVVGYPGAMKYVVFNALGMVLCCVILAKPIRIISARTRCYTLPDILAVRFGTNSTIRILSSLIILIGCLTYLVSQWSAMATALQFVIGCSYKVGVIIGSVIITAYVVAGGMLASMWTNFLQMTIMFVVAIIMLVKSVDSVGGFVELNTALANINPNYIQPWYEEAGFGITSILSFSMLVVMLSYGGQPSVNTKFMMIRDTKQIRWMPLISSVALIIGCSTVFTGLAGIVLVNNGVVAAPERPDLIVMSVISEIFPSVISALVLVAVMAAVMSTAESYLFSASSTLVHDLMVNVFHLRKSDKEVLSLNRIFMVLISIVTALMSLKPPEMISAVGGQAFGAFCAGFGPVLYLSLRWKRVNSKAAIFGMTTGLTVGGILPLLDNILFDGMLFPKWTLGGIGVVLSFVVIVIVSLVTKEERCPIWDTRINK